MEKNQTPNKCKIDFKKKGNKLVISMKGYCDKDEKFNINIEKEVDFPNFDNLKEDI